MLYLKSDHSDDAWLVMSQCVAVLKVDLIDTAKL